MPLATVSSLPVATDVASILANLVSSRGTRQRRTGPALPHHLPVHVVAPPHNLWHPPCSAAILACLVALGCPQATGIGCTREHSQVLPNTGVYSWTVSTPAATAQGDNVLHYWVFLRNVVTFAETTSGMFTVSNYLSDVPTRCDSECVLLPVASHMR